MRSANERPVDVDAARLASMAALLALGTTALFLLLASARGPRGRCSPHNDCYRVGLRLLWKRPCGPRNLLGLVKLLWHRIIDGPSANASVDETAPAFA